MYEGYESFKDLSKEERWRKYCGFLDLSLDEFMEIQRYLLMEQIELVADSRLGKKIMNNQKPKTVEEFRQLVPLTTYEDYKPFLSDKQEDALAEKPIFWCRTTGHGKDFKWVPFTERHYKRLLDTVVGGFILACANRKGEVNLRGGEKVVYTAAPRPYATGTMVDGICEAVGLIPLPPPEVAEKMEFRQRIEESFRLALRQGVDVVGSLSSVLVKIGDSFTEQSSGVKLSKFMLHPALLFRLSRALLRSKLKHRSMLPRDLWSVKGALCAGTDTSIYRERVAQHWGATPWELYSTTEAGAIAMHSWSKEWMTFVPHSSFLEFIPEAEWAKNREDKKYRPYTVLLDEVKEGECYEIIITNFYGMPFLRYRPGDLIKIVALKDEKTGINLPHMAFKSRADDFIDLANLARLDEKTVWQAIFNTGVKFEEWTACKEYDQDKTYLRLYLELKEEREPQEIAQMIDHQLQIIDVDYRDIDSWLELHPVRVTLLSPGTFQRFYDEKQKEGADLAHLKPRHMNAPESIIQRLLQLSETSYKE
jgi:hypothetical protein